VRAKAGDRIERRQWSTCPPKLTPKEYMDAPSVFVTCDNSSCRLVFGVRVRDVEPGGLATAECPFCHHTHRFELLGWHDDPRSQPA
jgi:hypothetical protein